MKTSKKPVTKVQVKTKAVVAKPAAPVKAKAKVAVPAKAAPKASPQKAGGAQPDKGAKPTVKAAAKVVPAKKAAVTTAVATAKTKPVASTLPKTRVGATKASSAVKAKSAPATSVKKAPAASQVKPMPVTKVEPSKSPASPAPAAPAAAAPDQLVRATRPSARLAQITVPSLPPAVASTAAKASFLPSAPAPVSVPFAPVKKDAKLAGNWKSKKLEDLTDAEVLAMPDAEYMNDVQMAYFRRKLVMLKQEILNSAGETTEHLREDTVVVPDPADRATIEEEHALELRTRDRERKLLKKIEQSIIRIDAGDYGFCDETGEAIGVGRLLARPTATLSLEAQQRRELKQKMFGD